jgi:ABC-2 type transport system permease protein
LQPRLVFNFARYEIKRSIARKKILVIMIFTLLIDTVPYIALWASGTVSIIPSTAYPYIWIAGIFLPQAFFIQFIAILIAAGAMAEEYEQGTAELLLSKPVSRMEYYSGKFLGGYSLLVFIVFLNSGVSLLSSYLTFGSQNAIGTIPAITLIACFAALLFFSFAFMIGELVRRSSLSYIMSSALFFSSLIVGFYLLFIFSQTGQVLYQQIENYLPTSPVGSLPVQYASSVLPSISSTVFDLVGASTTEPSIYLSVELLLVYSVAFIVVSALFFRYADISKKVS